MECRNRLRKCAAEFFNARAIDSALSIIGDYVNITAKEPAEELSMEMN